MKIDRLLSRFRSIKDVLGDPGRKEGTLYRGRFVLNGRCVEGWVVRYDGGPSCPPESVTVSYSDEVIATIREFTIREFTNGPPRWQFVFDTGSDITVPDVLQERFKVVAVNNLGQQLALLPEGRMQLDYIRETGPASDVELTIDFSLNGNAGPYLGEGWCHRGPNLIRTLGKVSFIEIPVKEPQAHYVIELRVRPYVVPGELPTQGLDVYLGNYLISGSSLRGPEDIVTFEVPQEWVAGQSIKLRLDLPDAARPSDLIPGNKDNRVLAIAFRTLLLKRRLDPDA
jgi:hypothetical protein